MEWGTERAWLSRKTKQPNNRSALKHQGLSLENPERLLEGGSLTAKIREEKDPADQGGRGTLTMTLQEAAGVGDRL